MEFICLGLGYDARMYKGVLSLAAQPAQKDDHPVLSTIALLVIALLEFLN